jgi:hypothetical protein
MKHNIDIIIMVLCAVALLTFAVHSLRDNGEWKARIERMR